MVIRLCKNRKKFTNKKYSFFLLLEVDEFGPTLNRQMKN